MVQRGDTLWGIAERELGDPLRWSEIFQMNEGRPEPGGATLSDPHWIDPGWTLLLPATTTTTPVSPATPSASPPPASMPPTSAPPITTPAATAPPTSAPATPNPMTTATVPRSHDAARSDRSGGEPVRLPSGSVVAGSFAAGVAATVAIGRLRRRHAYRYRPPEPGLDLSEAPLRPTLRLLTCSVRDPDDVAEDSAGATASARLTGANPAAATTGVGAGGEELLACDVEDRLRPGLLEVGVRDGQSVTIEVTDLSGAALSGPAANDVARALLAGLLVREGPGAAEVLCSGELAERLVPGLGPEPAIRRAGSALEVARVVEAERIARARRVDAAGANDARSYRAQHPENPLPALLVFVDAPSGESDRRWAGLCEGADRLGIAVVFLGDTAAATARVATDATHIVVDAKPERLARMIIGAELFALGAEEAAELLGSVFAASAEVAGSVTADRICAERVGADPAGGRDGALARLADGLADPDGLAELLPLGRPDGAPTPTDRAPMPGPEPVEGPDARLRPIRVEILGPARITISGSVVSAGLRSRARMLLAWYLCRPGGATAGQAVDALWPDTPPEGVLKQFWRALGDLRAALRGAGAETPEVLEKIGEHYRAKPTEISCDLWDFQAALAEAARASHDETARRALCHALDAYRGDLLEGADDDPWVEPVRAELHRRALDAQLRLAELDEHAGDLAGALAVLERAIELDRYAEEPYRRLMALHARCGRPDAIATTWKLLRRRLAELDLDVEAATVTLYRSLAAAEPSEARRPARPRS